MIYDTSCDIWILRIHGTMIHDWLVVSPHLKNSSQMGLLFPMYKTQIGDPKKCVEVVVAIVF